ncbi:conserved hypothetical protein [Desulforamulus reducens MI-1]|uniref:Uncharacterized protein n=1 Tax=Desulforamulus reducens (strain ATCC BAA-1160 / DSM 100696 / MI-1) TaxID=349161 RepID=A4J958_DESRM|nr:DUF5693 family protein [Desulforamulus reducens]ABO51611.1 conserved hypothetical protein [Desulforamulus reducens MI-1]
MSKGWKYSLWAVLVVAVLAAAHVAFWQRYMVEKDFKQVELAVNYDEINNIAGYRGLTPGEGLKQFKNHGVTAVVLRENVLSDLEVAGLLEIYSGQALIDRQAKESPAWLKELSQEMVLKRDRTYLVFFQQEIYNQVFPHIKAKLNSVTSYQVDQGTYIIETSLPYINMRGTLADIGIGFSKASLRDVQDAGLRPILQIRTWQGATQHNMQQVFALYRDIPGVAAVMFNDDTLPGDPDPALLPILAAEVRKLHVPLVKVEFFSQKGLDKLGVLLDKQVVRMHTVSQDELKKSSPAEAVDRFGLAAAERNHRLLYIRPYYSSGDVLQKNLDYVDGIEKRLVKEGLTVGPFDKLPPVPVNQNLVILIGLGVIAGGLLLLESLKPGKWVLGVGVVAVLVWVPLTYLDLSMARKLMALIAVIVFPSLSLIKNLQQEGRSPGAAVVAFLRISLFSLLGALFMVGLLAGAGFMLKLDQFIGVKVAHVVPLVIVMLFFSLFVTRGWGLQEKAKNILTHPLQVGIALAAGVMAVAIIIYVARTGNEAMTVSGLELKFRSLLDYLLGVRPRTKEFLLGHPALLLILLFGYRDNRFLPLLLLGTIGQASLVNTFAHIHTPLIVSLLRAFHGIWLGIIIGLAVYFLIKLVVRYGRRYLHG